MKNMTPWFLILALISGVPAFALAEETIGTTNTSLTAPIPGQPPVDMMQKRVEGRMGSGTPKLPPEGLRDAMKTRMENGTTGKPMPPGMGRMMGASGTKPMMGSGTRPFASGTPKMMERMKLLKDGKMDRQMEAAKSFIKNAAERMDNAIERLEKLTTRLEGAIAKMKEKGVDTTKTEGLLAIAKTKTQEARTAVTNALSSIEAAKPGSTGTTTGQISDTTRKAVKDALESAKEALKAAHKALVEAIASLSAAGGLRTGGNGTSTGTTTP